VDEYLSEQEQIEHIKRLVRENAWPVIAGVAIVVLGYFGWNQYKGYQLHQAEQAAALYQSLKQATDDNKTDDATALLAKLRSDFPSSAYTDQAGLLVAKTLLIPSPDKAADELRYVMEHSKESEMAMIARLRLARVLAYREQYDEALKLLSVPNPGKFAGRFNEVKGDIDVALGHVDDARAAYLAAMVSDGSELLDRNFLQMKLNDLPMSQAAKNEPAAAVPKEESPTAASGGSAAAPKEEPAAVSSGGSATAAPKEESAAAPAGASSAPATAPPASAPSAPSTAPAKPGEGA
jgi:predicted negative regulator of RcsB-dependent stress response